MKIESQEISLSLLKEKAIRLFVKRIDKIHPFVSGNKWYKLNEEYSNKWSNITKKKDPLPDAEKYQDEENKLEKYGL